METIAERTFDAQAQAEFACLSGDCNPLHLDEAVARKTLFGAPVVHAVHLLLWALESHLGSEKLPGAACQLRASFSRPTFLDAPIELKRGADRLVGAYGGAARLDVRIRPGEPFEALGYAGPAEMAVEPRALSFDEAAAARGTARAAADSTALAAAFPRCLEALGADGVAQILALTRIVGMECPGLHSIFTAFNVTLLTAPAESGQPGLRYSVRKADERIGMFKLDVGGSRLRGEIECFFRPPPAAQPDMEAVARWVDAGEFAGQRALIVGGSQGLGEATARIVAAGGGVPTVTYFRGREEAQRIVDDILGWGGKARAIPFDVLAPATGEAPTHLYYFATPKIFLWNTQPFDHATFEGFLRYYVDAFEATLVACRTQEPLRVFYPSSTALDEPVRGLAEYAMAKSAGETLCEHLNAFNRGLTIDVERLPRIDTNQTATLSPIPAAGPVETMLPIVRRMHG